MSIERKYSAASYEIGYGKPPRSGCFKKGQRANPRGRPKGSKNALTIFREEAEELITVRENGRTRKMSKMRVAIRNAMNNVAAKPDLKGIIALMKLSMTIQTPEAEFDERMREDQRLAAELSALTQEFMNEVVSFGRARDAELPPESSGDDESRHPRSPDEPTN